MTGRTAPLKKGLAKIAVIVGEMKATHRLTVKQPQCGSEGAGRRFPSILALAVASLEAVATKRLGFAYFSALWWPGPLFG
jgi:hypothetical protein